jgi:hypothetical protein
MRPQSSQSSLVAQSAKRLSFTRNMKTDVSRHLTSLEKGVAIEKPDCALVGYRKLGTDNAANLTLGTMHSVQQYAARDSLSSMNNFYGDRLSTSSTLDADNTPAGYAAATAGE